MQCLADTDRLHSRNPVVQVSLPVCTDPTKVASSATFVSCCDRVCGELNQSVEKVILESTYKGRL